MEAGMVDKILINIHSFVDVITNSSTELFVSDTKKSVELVTDILQYAVALHNKTEGTEYDFNDIFEDVYFGSIENILYNYFGGDCTSKIKNGIIIRGASDNSIPSWMSGFIEDTFGYSTERFHLG
jgi:hypothetical protein